MPPSYFVSNGCEMQMPNETWTFDLVWNSFPNEELTDSETYVFFFGGGWCSNFIGRKLQMQNAGSRTTDTTIRSRTTQFPAKSHRADNLAA